MDFDAIYHFLFETIPGIGCMVGGCLVLCIILAALLEVKTRKTYVDRGPKKDEWSLFDDDDEEEQQS